jgi:hypothetical protein
MVSLIKLQMLLMFNFTFEIFNEISSPIHCLSSVVLPTSHIVTLIITFCITHWLIFTTLLSFIILHAAILSVIILMVTLTHSGRLKPYPKILDQW